VTILDNLAINHAVRAYREQLLADPYRPQYHFAEPDGDGRPGDPNGCFFANHLHHLMYLYRKDGGPFQWAHVTSLDLLHWRHHEDALVKGDLDEGCFSGGAFVDDDGTAYLSYWIFNDGEKTNGRNAGIGLAFSKPPYEKWERFPDAVIPSTQWGIRDVEGPDGEVLHLGCADPSNIWKDGGVYYMQLGNLCVLNAHGRAPDSAPAYRGDWTELFSSRDLRAWTYEGRFYQRRADNAWTDETEDDMCPSYLPLPAGPDGGPPTDSMLQLFIAHNKGAQYYIGKQDGLTFVPESHGRMSWNDNAYFAPEAYIDGQGRQIVFAWLLDNLPDDFGRYGWSGVFALPRSVWLRPDRTLGIVPAQELARLRYDEQPFAEGAADVERPDCCELSLTYRLRGAGRAGIALRAGDEEALIYCDGQSLVMDLSGVGESKYAALERAPLALAPDEPLTLNIFIDRSVLEVFAQDRQAISRRVFFAEPEKLTIRPLAENASIVEGKSWSIAPTNMY
jgi:beta-fructofuranosidase